MKSIGEDSRSRLCLTLNSDVSNRFILDSYRLFTLWPPPIQAVETVVTLDSYRLLTLVATLDSYRLLTLAATLDLYRLFTLVTTLDS